MSSSANTSHVTLSDEFKATLLDTTPEGISNAQNRMGTYFDLLNLYGECKQEGVPFPEGDLKRLKELARHQWFDIHAILHTENRSFTLLHKACQHVLPDMVDFLLEQGASPTILNGPAVSDKMGDYHIEPLYDLVKSANQHNESDALYIANRLIGLGANPFGRRIPLENKIATEHYPAFNQATTTIHHSRLQSITELLLNSGVDPNITPKEYAPQYQGHDQQELMQKAIYRYAIYDVVCSGDLGALEALIDAGACLNFENTTENITCLEAAEKRKNPSAEENTSAEARENREKIYNLLFARRSNALALYKQFDVESNLSNLPIHALVYFANIGLEQKLLEPEVWQQDPQKMWLMTQQLPPYFSEKYSRELTAIANLVMEQAVAPNNVISNWSACGALDKDAKHTCLA